MAWVVWRLLARLFARGAPRVWFAREGLVEETPDGKVLFPWMRISRVECTEIRGMPFVLVWFRDDEVPFQVLDLQMSDPERGLWVERRTAALRQNVASSGAPLVLGEAVLEESPFAAYEQIRLIAADQRSLLDLPSVLDDPPDIDLKGLGIG